MVTLDQPTGQGTLEGGKIDAWKDETGRLQLVRENGCRTKLGCVNVLRGNESDRDSAGVLVKIRNRE